MTEWETYQAKPVGEEPNQDDIEQWSQSGELTAHYHQHEPNSHPPSKNHQPICASNDPLRQIWLQYLDWGLGGYYKLNTVRRSH